MLVSRAMQVRGWLRHLGTTALVCGILLGFVAAVLGVAAAFSLLSGWLGPVVGTVIMVVITVLVVATFSWLIEGKE